MILQMINTTGSKLQKKSSMSLEEIQHSLFDILKYIRDVCEQNGLRYYLAYGTLIGAVRHQSFIPWDDDADIHMPRKDYEAFLRIVTEQQHPFYKLVSRETNPKYNRLWARVVDSRTRTYQKSSWIQGVPVGLFVDIFILDGAGNTEQEAFETYRNAYAIFLHYHRAIRKMFVLKQKRFISFIKWVYHVPEKIRGTGYWIDRHISYCKQKDYDRYEFIGALGAGTKDPARNIWDKDWFGEGTVVFINGEHFCAPVNWDAVLRPEYGDYMALPPLEDQHPKHSYKVIQICPTT